MFKLKPDATFVATIDIPNGDMPLPLKVEFRRKRAAEIQEWIEASKTIKGVDALLEIVVGWKDVDSEYSPAAFAELLQAYPGSELAIYLGFLRALSGAERKN